MNHLKNIISIFDGHFISKYEKIRLDKFPKTKKHPYSEGIIFESSDFAREIFAYYSEGNEYYEMEFLIFKGEKHSIRIIEEQRYNELNALISGFLTDRLKEINQW